MSLPQFVSQVEAGKWRVQVHVQPGAKADCLAGLHGDSLKVRLRARAVDNKANKALVAYMASVLGLKKSEVSLISGQTSRQKVLLVETGGKPSFENMLGDG